MGMLGAPQGWGSLDQGPGLMWQLPWKAEEVVGYHEVGSWV